MGVSFVIFWAAASLARPIAATGGLSVNLKRELPGLRETAGPLRAKGQLQRLLTAMLIKRRAREGPRCRNFEADENKGFQNKMLTRSSEGAEAGGAVE
jgi:hypothetical protein